MKLELKHLAGYLPYGLKVKFINGDIEEIEGFRNFKKSNVFYKAKYGNPCSTDLPFKPILRPLSDLTQHAFSVWGISKKRFYKELKNGDLPYIILNELYEWHFDVHNLIPNGLAININDLNK